MKIYANLGEVMDAVKLKRDDIGVSLKQHSWKTIEFNLFVEIGDRRHQLRIPRLHAGCRRVEASRGGPPVLCLEPIQRASVGI